MINTAKKIWRKLTPYWPSCVLGLFFLALTALDADARVGGGHTYSSGHSGSYSGGGGGSGDSGALLWLIFQVFRVLIYLTFSNPIIGIPLDGIIICVLVYAYRSHTMLKVDPYSSSGGVAPYPQAQTPARAAGPGRQVRGSRAVLPRGARPRVAQ